MDWTNWKKFADEFTSRLNKQGVFLTSEHGGKVNTMTISWGSAGVYWSRPVITAPVRLSRFSHGLIAQSGKFTISIPKPGELQKELAFCGSKSGRNMDKFAECSLTAQPGRTVGTPVVGQAWMHIECRVMMTAGMSPELFAEGKAEDFYPNGDFHTLFLGEVVDFYET